MSVLYGPHGRRVRFRNWSGEIFTATLMFPGHVTAVLQASLIIQSLREAIKPMSSAIGMNSPGGIEPRTGCRQRSSASNPESCPFADRPAAGRLNKAIFHHRLSKIDLERTPRLEFCIHFRLEEAEGSRPSAFARYKAVSACLRELLGEEAQALWTQCQCSFQ